MSKKKSTFKNETPMNWWYSRIVTMEERDYQVVIKLLEEAAKANPEDKDIAYTLITFKKGQEAHYVSQKEYLEKKKAGII
jgi:hypothetical protein